MSTRTLALAMILFLTLTGSAAAAAVYEVGPGFPYATIGAVPLATLQPGDTVRINYKSAPYKEKWVIARQGTAAQPITFTGVPGPNGELPVIEGIGAITAPGLNYGGEDRGIIKIGGSTTPADTMPQYIIIQNLDIRGARSSNTFRNAAGATVAYAANAAAIYIEKCEHCAIRYNLLHDTGNPLFVASSDKGVSRDIIVEGNRIYGGGNAGTGTEHNVYSAAIGICFEANYMGQLVASSGGNNLQDRSAGAVIRYNFIEGGNRQLDLVDGKDAVAIRSDPGYRAAYVYGNTLIEHDLNGSRQMVQYGGDTGRTRDYRKGTMYFYNNTLVSNRMDRTTLFRASTNEETIDARNNIFYTVAVGATLSLADNAGVFNLSRNWIKPGWVFSFVAFSGVVNDDGSMVTGSNPGFIDEPLQDYHLANSSPCIDAGSFPNPIALPANDVTRQYVKHQLTEPRPADGIYDIGAYEFDWNGDQRPVAIMSATPESGMIPLGVSFSGTSSYDPDGQITSVAWDFGDGTGATGWTAFHTYTAVGTFKALIRVTDMAGHTASATKTITVNPLPAPTLTGSLSGSTVTLTWTDPSGSNPTGWLIERKSSKGTWTQVAAVTVKSYSETPGAGTWSYRVRSYIAAAKSAYSNEVKLTVK